MWAGSLRSGAVWLRSSLCTLEKPKHLQISADTLGAYIFTNTSDLDVLSLTNFCSWTGFWFFLFGRSLPVMRREVAPSSWLSLPVEYTCTPVAWHAGEPLLKDWGRQGGTVALHCAWQTTQKAVARKHPLNSFVLFLKKILNITWEWLLIWERKGERERWEGGTSM